MGGFFNANPGWSQGAGRPGNGDGSSIAAQRGGCLGARPKTRGQSPANWSLPHGGERHKRADRRSPTRDPASPQGLKSGSGRRTPRPRGGHGRGSGWCHPQEDDPLRAPHPLKDGGPGTGLGQFEGARTADGRRKTALVQAAVSGSRESSRPTSADGTRGYSDAEASAVDGGDDTRHVTSSWMQRRCRPAKPRGRGSSGDDAPPPHVVQR